MQFKEYTKILIREFTNSLWALIKMRKRLLQMNSMKKFSQIFILSALALSLSSGQSYSQSKDKEFLSKDKEFLATQKNRLWEVGGHLASGDILFAKNALINEATIKGVSETESFLRKYFPTVELNLDLHNNNNNGGLLLLIPLVSENVENTVFMQSSVFRKEKRTTVNIGLGYRRLEFDNKLLLGINAFYDREFPYHHQRASLGFEVRTTVGELNANLYRGLTGTKTGEKSLNEKGLGGFDIEAGIPLPYINWTKLFVREFSWKSEVSGVKDITGTDLSLRAAIPIIPGFAIEAVHRNYDRKQNGRTKRYENFVKLTYNITFGLDERGKNKKSWFSSTAYNLGSMEDRRFDKVRRENLIRKQITAPGTLTVSAI